MRGRFRDQGGLFSYLSPEARVPPRHPLRQIRELVRTVLKELSVNFGRLYSSEGRPSITPEQLRSVVHETRLMNYVLMGHAFLVNEPSTLQKVV